MPDDLYERDILVWSEKQASLLRRLARGEGVNEAIDWDHVIEEVEDVGASELHGCQSQISQALLHLLKLGAEPQSQAAAHWRSEIIGFLAGARRRFSPGMRQRFELDDLYDTALRQIRVLLTDVSGARLPEACPYTLDDLLVLKPDPEALIEKLRPQPTV